jgi:YfiH family protein
LYAARLTHGPVALAFTDRHGGVSVAPFASLNLAWAGDDAEALAENHRRLSADFAPDDPVAALSQVHGNDVAYVGPEGPRSDLHGHLHARADAVVTDQAGVTLMVRGADCAMVLFADADRRVIGAAHCGRPGLVAGVVPATVQRMRDLGAEQVTAWLGPHVCGRCYEVPAEMQDDVAAVIPASRATTSWGTPSVDLGAGIRAQLRDEQVECVDLSRCTRESPDLYSYRRDRLGSGRQAGVIRMAPDE